MGGLWIRAKCDPMVVKQVFFPKILPKIGTKLRRPVLPTSGGLGLRLQTPVNDMFELQYTSLDRRSQGGPGAPNQGAPKPLSDNQGAPGPLTNNQGAPEPLTDNQGGPGAPN